MIKHENMEYKRAVHYTAVVLELCAKTRKFVRELFESPDVSWQSTPSGGTLSMPLVAHSRARPPSRPPQNEVESLRLKTKDYEMVIAQHTNFTLLVIQEPVKETPSEEEGGEEKKAE